MRTRADFNREWIELVKETRRKFGDSLEEAHDRILAADDMRRLVAMRINRDPECRKMALYDLREYGAKSRFICVDDRIQFRKKDGQR